MTSNWLIKRKINYWQAKFNKKNKFTSLCERKCHTFRSITSQTLKKQVWHFHFLVSQQSDTQTKLDWTRLVVLVNSTFTCCCQTMFHGRWYILFGPPLPDRFLLNVGDVKADAIFVEGRVAIHWRRTHTHSRCSNSVPTEGILMVVRCWNSHTETSLLTV